MNLIKSTILGAAVAAFAAAAGNAFSFSDQWDERVVEMFFNKFFHKQIAEADFRTRVARAKTVKLLGIIVQFLTLNLVGVLVSRAFASKEFRVDGQEEAGEPWTWMTSFYWAIQTTTTVRV